MSLYIAPYRVGQRIFSVGPTPWGIPSVDLSHNLPHHIHLALHQEFHLMGIEILNGVSNAPLRDGKTILTIIKRHCRDVPSEPVRKPAQHVGKLFFV